MKRKKQFACILYCCLLGLIFSVMQVKAFTLVKEPQENVWTYRHGGGVAAFSGPFTYYSIGGKTTYCIEPGVHIEDDASYLGYEGMIESPYDNTINERIELIGYYGYDYPGHQTLEYRMATQALIWETTGPQTVEFWTEKSGGGKQIKVTKEKQAIENLITKHYDKPSFNAEVKETIIGKEVSFTDNSNILSEFTVQETEEAETRVDGNILYVKPKVSGNIQINLIKKTYTDNVSTLFLGEDIVTQKMGYFGLTNKVVASVNVNSQEIKFRLSKFDFSGSKTPKGDGTLEGAVYELYNNNDEKLAELVTDAEGMAYFNLPALGTYYVKEVKASRGYLVDPQKYYFTATESILNPRKNVYETAIQSMVEIYKYLSDGKTGEITAEPNITFEFYLKSKNTLQAQVKTNASGYLSATLPYGTYIIKQVDTIDGYEKVADFEITIDENTPSKITKYITNVKEKNEANLQVNKIDKQTKKIIPLDGIKFKIKNLDTNEYVCQNVSYPSNKKVCVYETKNGTFTTPEPLPYGNYALEEVDAKINGYLWNKEPLEFTINKDSNFEEDPELGKIFVINFTNEEVLGEVNITKYGEVMHTLDNSISYEDILLNGVKYELYAQNDIYRGDSTLVYKKDTLINTYSTKNGQIKITNLFLGDYYLKEIKTLDGYILNTENYYFSLQYIDEYTKTVTKDLTFKNTLIKGNLKLIKKDDLGKPLKDTKIAVYNNQDECIYEGITNEDGILELENLAYDTYYLKEKEAPLGYLLSEEKIEFTITENAQTIELELINNPILGTLEFKKFKKGTDIGLQDAEIEVYNLQDELIFRGKTDDLGQITLNNLRYGDYYIIEKTAPLGYVKNEEKIWFKITNDRDIIPIILENALITNQVEIIKRDQDTKEGLQDAEIEIYNALDELVFTGKTNADGFLNLELPFGDYYLIEKKAPLGYNKYLDKITFEVKNSDEVIKLEILDKKITGTLKIIKRDNDTSELLKDGEFAIYDADDNLITTGVTNVNGELIIDDLPYGDYYIIETKAPDNYLLNSGKIYFTIKEDKGLVTVNIPNHKIPTPLIVNVPKTSDYTALWLHIFLIINLLGGLTLIIYDKKK